MRANCFQEELRARKLYEEAQFDFVEAVNAFFNEVDTFYFTSLEAIRQAQLRFYAQCSQLMNNNYATCIHQVFFL